MFDVHFSVSPSGENNLALMPLMPAFLYTYTLCLALEPLYGLVFQCFITRKCDAHCPATTTADALVSIYINRALLINYCT